MSKTNLLLEMHGVAKHFPGVRALHGINLDVRSGEVHGLVGENGAGKSTLMGVASGALVATEGVVRISGQEMSGDPEKARDLGLAIVRQEPALMPDLSVAENLYLGLPASRRPSLIGLNEWAKGLLQHWSDDVAIDPHDHVATLNPEQRFIVEIVKALECKPKVLVLDEPTEHLTSEDVQRLFHRVREVVKSGSAVIYISHRIREVQEISDRLTVLRDGEGQGTFDARSMNEDEIVSLIVGGSLDQTFPVKANLYGKKVVLATSDFSGPGFSNVSLQVREGEILGLAGIDANGQREFMRALAGIYRGHGDVGLLGSAVQIKSSKAARKLGISYLPGDRHREGIFPELSVRENFSIRSIADDANLGLVSGASEQARTRMSIRQFAVKTPHGETPIQSLSGGNQQKVVLSSVLAMQPKVLLVDAPTQGVDVGARAEIYRVIREAAASGVAVILVSSDQQEVAGLSDNVAIFSRGRVVEMLSGDAVTEDNITSAVLKSTQQREKHDTSIGKLWKWAAGNVAPLVMVATAIVLLGAVAGAWNPFYLSPRSLSNMMMLSATLAFVAYGQQILMLVSGIDLSVGPTMGLVQVVASFFIISGMDFGTHFTGWVLLFGVAIAIGFINWILVEGMKLHPMVATLATYMAVQAVSLIFRPVPKGMIDGALMKVLGTKFGIFPATFIAAVLMAILLEFLLYKRRIGVSMRGLGSRQEAARTAGVRPVFTRLIAYVGCSVFAAFAAVTMFAQVGIGDPRAGLSYTLGSIAAVVIGGASLFGGRGSFIGTLLGSVFITQVSSVTVFLRLSQEWQQYLLGFLILASVALYSKSREKVVQS